MKHTAKRRTFAHRPFPIGITSFYKEVANRLFVQQRLPLSGLYHYIMCAALCQFAALGRLLFCLNFRRQKSRLVVLDKATEMAIMEIQRALPISG